jgi:hypothetical protein
MGVPSAVSVHRIAATLITYFGKLARDQRAAGGTETNGGKGREGKGREGKAEETPLMI